jgi:hypothetical protein
MAETEPGATTHAKFSLTPGIYAAAAASSNSSSPTRRRGPAGSRGLAAAATGAAPFTLWYRCFVEAVSEYSTLNELVAAERTCRSVRALLASNNVWLRRFQAWDLKRRRDEGPGSSSIFTDIAEDVRVEALRRNRSIPRLTYLDDTMHSRDWKSLFLRMRCEDVSNRTRNRAPTIHSKTRSGLQFAHVVAPQLDPPDEPARFAQCIMRLRKRIVREQPANADLSQRGPFRSQPIQINSGGMRAPDIVEVCFELRPLDSQQFALLVESEVRLALCTTLMIGGEIVDASTIGPPVVRYSEDSRAAASPLVRGTPRAPQPYTANTSWHLLVDCSPFQRFNGHLLHLNTTPPDEDLVVLFEACALPAIMVDQFRSDAVMMDGDIGSEVSLGASVVSEDGSGAHTPAADDVDSNESPVVRFPNDPRITQSASIRLKYSISSQFPFERRGADEAHVWPETIPADERLSPALKLRHVLDDPRASDVLKAAIADYVSEQVRVDIPLNLRYILQRAIFPRLEPLLRSPRRVTRRCAQSLLWNITDAPTIMVKLDELRGFLDALVGTTFATPLPPLADMTDDMVAHLNSSVGCLWNIVCDRESALLVAEHETLFPAVIDAFEMIRRLAHDFSENEGELNPLLLGDQARRPRSFDACFSVAQLLASVLYHIPRRWAAASPAHRRLLPMLDEADRALVDVHTLLHPSGDVRATDVVMSLRDAADYGVRYLVRSKWLGCVAYGSVVLASFYEALPDE